MMKTLASGVSPEMVPLLKFYIEISHRTKNRFLLFRLLIR